MADPERTETGETNDMVEHPLLPEDRLRRIEVEAFEQFKEFWLSIPQDQRVVMTRMAICIGTIGLCIANEAYDAWVILCQLGTTGHVENPQLYEILMGAIGTYGLYNLARLLIFTRRLLQLDSPAEPGKPEGE